MYYYSHKSDVRPKGVIFLTGSIVERVSTHLAIALYMFITLSSDRVDKD